MWRLIMSIKRSSVSSGRLLNKVIIAVIAVILLVYLIMEHIRSIDQVRFMRDDADKAGISKDYTAGVELKVDMEKPSYKIWHDDDPSSKCYSFETRFGINLKRVWLLSFPGSGNTWTRYLIEASTGIFTGSVYIDASIYSKGFLGEKDNPGNGRTLTQKTHGSSLSWGIEAWNPLSRRMSVNPRIPTVFILRNPKKAILSYWNYLKSKGEKHTNKAPLESFKTEEFHKFVIDANAIWTRLIVDQLLWTEAPLHIVYYENLKKNTIQEVRGILHFLGIPPVEERLQCIESHLSGSFKRSQTAEKELDQVFSEKHKKAFQASIALVKRLLLEMGFPEPPVYEI